jgi:multidrug resistance efflux pump
MFGYRSDQVEKRIKEIEAENAAKKEQAEKALEQAVAENRELMEKLKTLYAENAKAEEFDRAIGDVLREAFIASSEDVFNYKSQAKQNIDSKYDRLETLKEKNNDINESIDKLLIKLGNTQNG